MSAPHVRYDDAVRPITSKGGGVYPLRSRQNTGVGSLYKPSVTVPKTKDEDIEGEDDGFDERDIKKKQVRRLTYYHAAPADVPPTDLRRLETLFPCLPIRWRHLRRHWNEPSLRVLLNLHRRSQLRRPSRSIVSGHLDCHIDGQHQVRLDCSTRRRRR